MTKRSSHDPGDRAAPKRPKGSVVPPRLDKGQTTYALRFIDQTGKRRWITTTHTSREDAERELRHVLADCERDLWRPRAKATPAPSNFDTRSDEYDDGFTEYAEAWLKRREGDGLRPRTIESLEWAIAHLAGHLRETPIALLDIRAVDDYRIAKLKEGRLSGRTLNATLRVLAQILDDAIEENLLTSNPARGRRRRAKQSQPRRSWLEMAQLTTLVDVAGDHAALIGAMGYAGLRVSEVVALKWGAVDTANGYVRVLASKTDAGRREVPMMGLLRDLLLSHKARAADSSNEALVFPSPKGGERTRHSVRDVLQRAVAKANVRLEAAGEPIIEACTNHSLRRSYCAIRFASGATIPEVTASMGHVSAAMSLNVYSKVLVRQTDTTSKADEMLRAAFEAVRPASDPVDQALAALLDDAETAR